MSDCTSIISVVTGALGLTGKGRTKNFLTSTAHQLRSDLSLAKCVTVVWVYFLQ